MGRVWFYVLRFSCSHSPVRRILRYAVCGLAERFSQRKPTLIYSSVYYISCGFAIVFICNIEKISGGFACKTHKSACRRAWQARLLEQSGIGCKFLVKHRQNQVVQALLVHGKLQMVLGADGTLAGRHPEDIPGKAHGRGLGGQIDDVAQVKVGEHIVADGVVQAQHAGGIALDGCPWRPPVDLQLLRHGVRQACLPPLSRGRRGRACGKEIPYRIAPRRSGDVAACYADVSKAKEVLGWNAQLGIDDMCRSAWNWQRRNPNVYEK